MGHHSQGLCLLCSKPYSAHKSGHICEDGSRAQWPLYSDENRLGGLKFPLFVNSNEFYVVMLCAEDGSKGVGSSFYSLFVQSDELEKWGGSDKGSYFYFGS
jgi:hypothetical protein